MRFEREWRRLRAYAAERGVRLIGDVPIYVAAGSADHRAHPELFRADAVAGTPPDAFTTKGQLWGNPLYDWPALQRRGYAWWIARLARTFALFDLARIDHFRGFVAYWAVPRRARHALGGRWQRGPGRAPFAAAQARARGAADHRRGPRRHHARGRSPARRRSGCRAWPCSSSASSRRIPRASTRWRTSRADRVAYTGTHDNDTLRGWYETLPEWRRAVVDARRPHTHPEVWWDLIALTFSSRARIAMLQAQDVLGLGSEARMNQPGTRARRLEVAAARAARRRRRAPAAGGRPRPRAGSAAPA